MATNPLLLVRASAETKNVPQAFKTVIVPLDGSRASEQALPHACEMARRLDLEVILIRVYTIPVMGFTAEDYYTPSLEQILEKAKEEARSYIDGKAAELEHEGLKRVSARFLEGESADQIIDLAKKTPGSLIAMSTHGRSGIERLVLGSVTSRVVRHSGDPVLVVRASG
jgi:nucleotide-binding universal stress UspA family protein